MEKDMQQVTGMKRKKNQRLVKGANSGYTCLGIRLKREGERSKLQHLKAHSIGWVCCNFIQE